MSTNGLYAVVVEEYARRHFIKGFERKFPGRAWEVTLAALTGLCARMDAVVESDPGAVMHACGNRQVVKLDFAVAGRGESPKSSGNRAVVFVDHDKRECRMLLVYAKTDVRGHNETAWWRAETLGAHSALLAGFGGMR